MKKTYSRFFIILIILLSMLILGFFINKKSYSASVIDDPSTGGGRAFSNFATNVAQYCLNRGKTFSRNDYGYSLVQRFTIRGKTITPTTFTPPQNCNGLLNKFVLPGNELNFYKVAYIILNNPSSKASIGGTANQVAMWKVTSPNETLPASSSGYIDAGTLMYNNATAYAEWIKNGTVGLTITGNNATLDNGFLGPFKLTYKPKVSSGNRRIWSNIIKNK